jgi:FkbM family methyltransferase
MPFLNRARLFANKVLSPAGFAINRVRKTNPWGSRTVTTQVGRFNIQSPRSSPLRTVYEDFPGHMEQLTTLVRLLKSKYPDLQAIDVGANVGDTACIIKSAADIPLVCIEGDGDIFELLQENVSQFQGVTAHKLFLGEKTGDMAVTLENKGWNAAIRPANQMEAQTIDITSLDDFLAGRPVSASCKLLKIDAEGFDCSIIRGAGNFLQRMHPVIIFEFNREVMEAIGENGLSTLAMLRRLGYSRVAFHDCTGRFVTDTSLSNELLVMDLLGYADGKFAPIYLDLTVFHGDDEDAAVEFIQSERARRPKSLQA